jgi:chemotaxis protein CheD
MAETPLTEVYVQPGECCVVSRPAILRTVLGSCVGIAFLIPRLGVAALCHPMLPSYRAKPPEDSTVALGCRYVDFAIREVARRLECLGARRGEIKVKLFGGADVLLTSNPSSRPTVGKMNCEAALRVLDECGIEVVASSLGGTSGINLRFNTETGVVLLRRLC